MAKIRSYMIGLVLFTVCMSAFIAMINDFGIEYGLEIDTSFNTTYDYQNYTTTFEEGARTKIVQEVGESKKPASDDSGYFSDNFLVASWKILKDTVKTSGTIKNILLGKKGDKYSLRAYHIPLYLLLAIVTLIGLDLAYNTAAAILTRSDKI